MCLRISGMQPFHASTGPTSACAHVCQHRACGLGRVSDYSFSTAIDGNLHVKRCSFKSVSSHSCRNNAPARCATGQPFLTASSATAATRRPHSFTSFAISTASTKDRWSGMSLPVNCPSEADAAMSFAARLLNLPSGEGLIIVAQSRCISDSKKLKASSCAAKYSTCSGNDDRVAEEISLASVLSALHAAGIQDGFQHYGGACSMQACTQPW